MKRVKQLTKSIFEEKKSKFFSFLCPYAQFDTLMSQLKDEHPKARHFVYAYRYLNEHDQVVENQSDDGEPKGSSGKPTLAVLRGADLINTGIITVRYFGGVKLGVGGLVRAYSDSANQAVQEAKLTEYKKLINLKLRVPYNQLGKVEHHLTKFIIYNMHKEFGADNILLSIEIPEEDQESFLGPLLDIVHVDYPNTNQA